jgi:transposase
LTKEIARNKVRVKSFLYYHGIVIPTHFSKTTNWSKQFTLWLQDIEFPTSSAKATLTYIIELVLFLRTKHLEVLKQIRALSKQEPYQRNVGLLMSIPGIGLITAMTFLTEIEDITRFKNLDKLCSYIGLVPTTNSSGEHNSVGNITKRQNKILRSMIIESSWMAIRNDPALMLAYQKLTVRMKPSKSIIRIAKKMINRIRYVLKQEKPYVNAVVK